MVAPRRLLPHRFLRSGCVSARLRAIRLLGIDCDDHLRFLSVLSNSLTHSTQRRGTTNSGTDFGCLTRNLMRLHAMHEVCVKREQESYTYFRTSSHNEMFLRILLFVTEIRHITTYFLHLSTCAQTGWICILLAKSKEPTAAESSRRLGTTSERSLREEIKSKKHIDVVLDFDNVIHR